MKMPIFDAIGFEIRRATRLLPTFSQQHLFDRFVVDHLQSLARLGKFKVILWVNKKVRKSSKRWLILRGKRWQYLAKHTETKHHCCTYQDTTAESCWKVLPCTCDCENPSHCTSRTYMVQGTQRCDCRRFCPWIWFKQEPS